MRFLIKRGKRALYREARAHIARYDTHGQVAGAFCHRSGFDMSSNVPWGLKVCKDCRRISAPEVAEHLGGRE